MPPRDRPLVPPLVPAWHPVHVAVLMMGFTCVDHEYLADAVNDVLIAVLWTVADSVFGYVPVVLMDVVLLSVQEVTVATPELLVSWLVPVADPPPEVTAKMTVTLGTTFENTSRTVTCGSDATAVPIVAV